MASSSSASPLTPHMDERGFLFMLPHLGRPDPAGEWVSVKAAIGKMADVVNLVVNPSIETPMHPPVAFNDMAVLPVIFQRAFWTLMLVRPQSTSPTTPPEFFTISLKRGPANQVDIPAHKLADDIDWLFWPMAVFEEQMAAIASPSGGSMMAHQRFRYGRAEHVRKWQVYERTAHREVSKQQTRQGDIINADWEVPLWREMVLAAASRGDESLSDGKGLKTFLRVHPAPDGDFRSIDYVVCRRSESAASVSEDRWKPLPPQATRPDGDRKYVNHYRAAVGKRRFTKEEWVAVRAEEEQRQQGPSSG